MGGLRTNYFKSLGQSDVYFTYKEASGRTSGQKKKFSKRKKRRKAGKAPNGTWLQKQNEAGRFTSTKSPKVIVRKHQDIGVNSLGKKMLKRPLTPSYSFCTQLDSFCSFSSFSQVKVLAGFK